MDFGNKDVPAGIDMHANHLLSTRVLNFMDGGSENLVSRARRGDQEAFGHLVAAHARPLYQLCFRITRDAALAEDSVQEAFYNAWRGLVDFDERAAFSTWLHRIAANAALEQLRRNARHRRELVGMQDGDDGKSDFLAALADEQPGPEARASADQIGDFLAMQMRRLSAAERAAFVMRHFEGERLEVIAQTLSMNVGQCKQAIFRAVRKLRRALEPMR